MSDIHCPMIHGGLQINLKLDQERVYFNQCCLRNELFYGNKQDLWNRVEFAPLRRLNEQSKWDNGCWTCQGNEAAGLESLRTGTLQMFGKKTNLSGPVRLDLMFDIGCNLACRTCGPDLSTYWQKHLRENNLAFTAARPESRVNDMIEILKGLDLSNLELVVFCGGETLLGNGYWAVAEAIAELVPDAKNKIVLSFQTNGTQTIADRHYRILEKFKLVKLNISLDGVGSRFEYLRWPASWESVVNNILDIRKTAPTNVMFLIEETVSIFNLFYQTELDSWVKGNFETNRLGDIVNHTKHVAHGIFGLRNLSQEYVDALPADYRHLVSPQWKENTQAITRMITEIEKFDNIRKQDWRDTFPEVAEFYKRFANS